MKWHCGCLYCWIKPRHASILPSFAVKKPSLFKASTACRPLMWAITYCAISILDHSLQPHLVPRHTITGHSVYPATMGKTERALMISPATLIDTFNFNTRIKTSEMAKWMRALTALAVCRCHIFTFIESAVRLQSWVKLLGNSLWKTHEVATLAFKKRISF